MKPELMQTGSMLKKFLRSLTESELHTDAIHHHPGNAFGA